MHLVQPQKQRHRRAEAMVRLRKLPALSSDPRGKVPAGRDYRTGHEPEAHPGHPAHGHGKIHLLPGARAEQVRDHGKTHGGHITPGRPDGRPDTWTPAKWNNQRRHHQRHAHHARAQCHPGPGAPRRNRHPPHVTRATEKPHRRRRHRPAGRGHLGPGRKPLPGPVGTRLPPGPTTGTSPSSCRTTR